jgi:hypothetical protein
MIPGKSKRAGQRTSLHFWNACIRLGPAYRIDRLGDAGCQTTMRRWRCRPYQRTTGLGCRWPYRRMTRSVVWYTWTARVHCASAWWSCGPFVRCSRSPENPWCGPAVRCRPSPVSPRCDPACRGSHSAVLRRYGPSIHARSWSGKARCGHSGCCHRLPLGKPRCGASRCGRVGWSRRGGMVGELKVIDDLGRHILVFITLTGPFGIFAAASHSSTFSATP